MDQRELARQVGVHSQTISRYETGDIRLTEARLYDLATALGTTPAALLGGDPFTPAEPKTAEDGPSVPAVTPQTRPKLPPRAYARVYEYLERLREAEIPEEAIEEFERLMVNPLYSQINKRTVRDRSEDELIMDIDAMWTALKVVVSRNYGKEL